MPGSGAGAGNNRSCAAKNGPSRTPLCRAPNTSSPATRPANVDVSAARQSPTRSRTIAPVSYRRVSVLLRYRTLAIYVAAGSTFTALSARGFLVPLYAHGLGASRFEVGALFSVSTLAAALLSLPSGVLIDRFGARTLLWTSIVVSAVTQVATAATTTVAPLFFWQVVGGLAGGAQ